MMNSYFINYVLVGLLINFICEVILKKEDRIEYTILQRMYLVFTWPISLIVFIYEFIRVLMYGKDD